jgi:hypothetical protein
VKLAQNIFVFKNKEYCNKILKFPKKFTIMQNFAIFFLFPQEKKKKKSRSSCLHFFQKNPPLEKKEK